jgi:hypothetical protein
LSLILDGLCALGRGWHRRERQRLTGAFHERAQAQTFIQLARQNFKPPSEVTRAPWKSTRKELLNDS